jgi:hypothetical protein
VIVPTDPERGRLRREGASSLRGGADVQGVQVTCTPFVRLKVLAVQNDAALRYQTW